MKKKDYFNKVHSKLAPFMAERGFEYLKSHSRYLNRNNDYVQSLTVDVLKHAGKNYFVHLSCQIGFPRLENAYVKHHIYAHQADGVFSISMNCNNIISSAA